MALITSQLDDPAEQEKTTDHKKNWCYQHKRNIPDAQIIQRSRGNSPCSFFLKNTNDTFYQINVNYSYNSVKAEALHFLKKDLTFKHNTCE
jgi:hypothetical protein